MMFISEVNSHRISFYYSLETYSDNRSLAQFVGLILEFLNSELIKHFLNLDLFYALLIVISRVNLFNPYFSISVIQILCI